MHRFTPRGPALALALAAAAYPRPAHADGEVTSETAAQFYDIRSPSGGTIVARRRLTTTLGVASYDLLDRSADPRAPSITFRARLRYDADYGGTAEETNPASFAGLVPGFTRGPVDLMYGYVEGRNFFRGVLGFRVGRQYVTDALGWWSFDGGLLRATTPYGFAIETYGGLEQRGGLPFSTPRFERDGMWRGDRSGYDPSLYPSFQPNEVAPAIGGAVETAGIGWLHARASYRRVYNTGAATTSPFAGGGVYDGTRISTERVGAAADAFASFGAVKSGFSYDLYAARTANVFASADWYATKKLTFGVDYDFYKPTFDADSIWNYFVARPMNDLAVRTEWLVTSHVDVTGGVRGRLFGTDDPMGGLNLAGRYRMGEGSLGVRGVADFAQSGDRLGMDVYGERTLETRYVFQARTGVWSWSDDLRRDRDAVNVGYVLGAGYKLYPRSMVLADFQHDMNRVGGQRLRAMIWLSVALFQ